MSEPGAEGPAPRKALLPLLALAGGAAVSLLLFSFVKDSIESEARLRFERQASDAQHVIEQRVHSYIDVIQGLSALFRTDSPISRAQFHRYVSGLDLANRYPGFQILNYAAYVRREDKAAFESRVRKDRSLDPAGYPWFSISPAGDRPAYYVLTYLEPMAGNEVSFGRDIGSNPVVAAALETARDTGAILSSGRLIQIEGPHRHVGFAIRLPVYRAGFPLVDMQQRRNAYAGSIGAGFRVKELMRGVLDEHTLRYMRFRIYDAGSVQQARRPGDPNPPDRLLFDSESLSDADSGPAGAEAPGDSFSTSLPIRIAGRIWDIQLRARKSEIIDRTDAALPWLVLAGGLVSSLLLFFTFHGLASSRGRALQMARVITKDLRESEASLAEAQRMAHLGNWSLDPVPGTMSWSAETLRIFGLGAGVPMPRLEDFLRSVHEKDRAAFLDALQRATRDRQGCELEHRIRARDRGTRWVHTIMRPAPGSRDARLHGTVRDITDAKLASLRLHGELRVTQLLASAEESDDVMEEVLEAICAGFGWECGMYWSLDKNGALLGCTASWGSDDPRVAEFVGLASKMSIPPGIDLPGRAWSRKETMLADVERDPGFSRGDVAMRGGLRVAAAVPVAPGTRFGGVMELFSGETLQGEEVLLQLLKSIGSQVGQFLQRKFAEDALRFVATHDPLTDLGNRAMFNDQLGHALRRTARYSRGLAVLFVDIDRFKVVNDTLGHSAGDRMLQQCAARLKDCLRGGDAVARLGGDEFVVLVEDYSGPRDAIAVAQKILATLAKPMLVEGQEFLPSASIGISIAPDDGADVEMLLRNADIAMYRAKEQGRNNYQFYSAQMNKHTFERLAMESSLRRAVERNEFLIHYQPKLDLETGAIAGVEALVRWNHPDLGMVSPAQFIPLAEETGLIVQIGEWVLYTACEQACRWRESGFPALRVAVNLSARQFAQRNLLRDVAAVMARTGLPPECLEFEITESLVMQNPEHAAVMLQKLKAMGITLSIDDFGTGYSSLGYLKRFPIDCVKIDRSFIKDIPTDADDMAITRGVIALGHSLRLKVVAEGVETAEQQEFLRAHGCDEMQGYLFSKPLAAEEVTALLVNHAQRSRLTVVTPRKRA